MKKTFNVSGDCKPELHYMVDISERLEQVVSLDFQMMSYANFESEQAFVAAFSGELLDHVENLPEEVQKRLNSFAEGNVLLGMVAVPFCRQ